MVFVFVRFYPVMQKKSREKEKKRAHCPLLTLLCKLLCLDLDDFTAIVGAASLAGSVGQTGLTALGASDDTGDRQLPVGVTSLISSCLGNFSLGYCHLVHLLG
jgi:hypothetical protein